MAAKHKRAFNEHVLNNVQMYMYASLFCMILIRLQGAELIDWVNPAGSWDNIITH